MTGENKWLKTRYRSLKCKYRCLEWKFAIDYCTAMKWLGTAMKWLAFAIVGLWAGTCECQWLSGPNTVSFARPAEGRRVHAASLALSDPAPELPYSLFQNVNITRSSQWGQFEPSVAVLLGNSPQSDRLIAGFIDDTDEADLAYATSSDGGLSWSRALLPQRTNGSYDIATDPSVAFNSGGAAFYVSGYTDLPAFPANAVGIFRSTDDGGDWTQRTDLFENMVDTSSDKYYLAIDRNLTSLYYGTIYVAWVDEGPSGRPRIVCSHSTDEGNSWSERVYLSPEGTVTDPVPAVEEDGSVLVTYVDYLDRNQILVTTSKDGGATFSAPREIAPYRNLGPMLPNDDLGFQNIGPPDSALAVNSFPTIAIDGNEAYVAWCSDDADHAPHVWLSMSGDDGATWSSPRAVETDSVPNASARFFPWAAIDPNTHDVGIAYYAAWMDTVAKSDGTDRMLEAGLYLAHSRDSGRTFATRRISSATFDPIVNEDYRSVEGQTLWFFGDYIGLVADRDVWRPVWCDSRSGEAEIYTANVDPYTPLPVTDLEAHDTTVGGRPGTVLTWTDPVRTVFGYPIAGPVLYTVYVDSTELTVLGASGFVDTSSSEGHIYRVYDGSWDSVRGSKAGVELAARSETVSVRWASEPAVLDREDRLTVESEEPGRVSVVFYDALGRALGPPMSDDMVSSHHELVFTPTRTGAQFFVLQETTSRGVRAITGKVTVLAP